MGKSKIIDDKNSQSQSIEDNIDSKKLLKIDQKQSKNIDDMEIKRFVFVFKGLTTTRKKNQLFFFLYSQEKRLDEIHKLHDKVEKDIHTISKKIDDKNNDSNDKQSELPPMLDNRPIVASDPPVSNQLPQYHKEHQAPLIDVDKLRIASPIKRKPPTSLLSQFEEIQRKRQEAKDGGMSETPVAAAAVVVAATTTTTTESIDNAMIVDNANGNGNEDNDNNAQPTMTTTRDDTTTTTTTTQPQPSEARPAYVDSLITNLLSPSRAPKRSPSSSQQQAQQQPQQQLLHSSLATSSPNNTDIGSSAPSSPIVHRTLLFFFFHSLQYNNNNFFFIESLFHGIVNRHIPSPTIVTLNNLLQIYSFLTVVFVCRNRRRR
jgi:hypothetical protein